MSITFIHAADIHLDSPLRGLERYEHAPVDRIRGATRRAFERLIQLTVDRRVDFLLIAGDLYDGDWRDYNTGLYLVGQLNRLREANIPVFIIAGNHDAANKMTRALRLPDNVRVLGSDRAETVRLDQFDVAIHGQSFARAAVTENLAAGYPDPVPGWVNIGLLHTGLTGLEGHERYAPCTVEDLRERGYDYWALGHIHTRGNPCLDPLVVFPGNTQGRHIRETGEKGCLLATLEPGNGVAHTFHRLDVVRWERGRVDASDLDTEADLLDKVAAVFDDLLQAETDADRLLAVRVVIHGASTLHDRLHADPERYVAEVRNLALERGVDRLWVEKVEIQTRSTRMMPVLDGPIEELREVLDLLRADPEALAALGEELTELRRKLPPDLTGGHDPLQLNDPEWLRAQLDEVQPFLLDLLLRPDRGAQS
ncbi:exonuclease SbcCD subunit D [Singulisphaera sp. GP187]|uniref:metallophosphoesterase family protein n=1 Tax=Singulisphaera sp. GP187 TaxID=1882752 RepID=UPI0009406C11|nr:DNA repair exonuclease [Singulisphaera sp. GP187]